MVITQGHDSNHLIVYIRGITLGHEENYSRLRGESLQGMRGITWGYKGNHSRARRESLRNPSLKFSFCFIKTNVWINYQMLISICSPCFQQSNPCLLYWTSKAFQNIPVEQVGKSQKIPLLNLPNNVIKKTNFLLSNKTKITFYLT